MDGSVGDGKRTAGRRAQFASKTSTFETGFGWISELMKGMAAVRRCEVVRAAQRELAIGVPEAAAPTCRSTCTTLLGAGLDFDDPSSTDAA